jgi:hypothetical protein
LKFKNSLHNASNQKPMQELIGNPIRKTAAYTA